RLASDLPDLWCLTPADGAVAVGHPDDEGVNGGGAAQRRDERRVKRDRQAGTVDGGEARPHPPGGRQAAEATTEPIPGAAEPTGRVTGAAMPSVWATRVETSRRTAESGTPRAPQIEPSSSDEASFSPRSTSLR